jgi:BirA family transcriptional regulator, biotin operon repressor / biotin---[acetyl-CoA-carboxylase] ligase
MDFALGPKARAAGYRLEAFETIGSTNAEAMSRARAGDAGALWIVSGHQSAGRGRRGRNWGTPSGNLAASLLLVVDYAPSVAATLGFVAGLALDDALRRVVPELAFAVSIDGMDGRARARGHRLRLKWPNDVLLDGGKLAGILLEAEPTATGRLAVVVGIGVNVVDAPRDLPYRATALAELGMPVNAGDLFRALSDAWAGAERVWDEGRGFPNIRALWLERAVGIGEEVSVRVGDEVLRGAFDTIDEEGRLVIRDADDAYRTISAGEVHLGAVVAARR